MQKLADVSKSLKDGDVWVPTDTEGFHRSVHNKAILNTNNKSLEEYKRARKIRLDNKKTIEEYSKDMNHLKDEVSEIKDSLNQIINAMNSRNS